jgi:hypothetical protein
MIRRHTIAVKMQPQFWSSSSSFFLFSKLLDDCGFNDGADRLALPFGRLQLFPGMAAFDVLHDHVVAGSNGFLGDELGLGARLVVAADGAEVGRRWGRRCSGCGLCLLLVGSACFEVCLRVAKRLVVGVDARRARFRNRHRVFRGWTGNHGGKIDLGYRALARLALVVKRSGVVEKKRDSRLGPCYIYIDCDAAHPRPGSSLGAV